LAHEPVLAKLREHKAFAKKFARALGRGEWSSAKSLEDSKPVYRIDHIIKERCEKRIVSKDGGQPTYFIFSIASYPSFVDAVRDIDDALCMIFLFASLPSSPRIPPSLIASCAKLAAEWQLYVIQSHALRKVFLSIKGVYYQAEIMDEKVTWLVPYLFTQSVSNLYASIWIRNIV
jgi:pescadillo